MSSGRFDRTDEVAGASSSPTRHAARLLDPLTHLRSLRFLHIGHLDVPAPAGGSEWRWGVKFPSRKAARNPSAFRWAAALHEPLDERERFVADLAPAAVDCQR